MRTLNRVMLIGNLGADPEIRQDSKGRDVANFSLATNRNVRSDDGKKAVADFHRVVAFGSLAKICKDYLSKGTAVYVDGYLVNRSFDDKNGERRFKTEIFAEKLNILTWKKSPKGSKEIEIEDLSESEEESEVVPV